MRGSCKEYNMQKEEEESISDSGCYFSITWSQSTAWPQINPWVTFLIYFLFLLLK